MLVTIALCTFNVENYISECLKALLDQTFSDFEIVIVDDSTDSTGEIVQTFNDRRIRYFKNRRRLGLSKSRNECIKSSTGKYVFFTDADCVVSRDWIQQGLKSFSNSSCVGVEGKTYYVSEKYVPTFSDSVIENKHGGQFMCCNIAYEKKVLEEVGGFDERYHYYFEDRDLALRVKKLGKIEFNPRMIVYHRKVIMTPKHFIRRAERVRGRVLLFKRFQDRRFGRIPDPMWHILHPLDLMTAVCPPLIFSLLGIYNFRNKEDWILLPYAWMKKVRERLNIWDTCAREKIFLV